MALKINVKGSTLIETMCAMVIISMGLGVGTLTMSGVLDSSNSHQETIARIVSGSNEDQFVGLKSQTILTDYKEVPELVVQTIVIVDESGKQLHSEKKLIPKTK